MFINVTWSWLSFGNSSILANTGVPGFPGFPKMDEFAEKLQTAFDPPPPLLLQGNPGVPIGKPPPTKTDEFTEKFQTAFDPPQLIFGKSYRNFFGDALTSRVKYIPNIMEILQYNLLYRK